MHFKLDCSTPWRMPWLAFQVRHPRLTVYKAAVRQQLRVTNATRRSLLEWPAARWFQHGDGATESVLQRALTQVEWEILDVTAQPHQREGLPTLQLPWEKWADTVPGQDVAVYSDARAREDSDPGSGCGVGLVTRIGGKWWAAAVPLEDWKAAASPTGHCNALRRGCRCLSGGISASATRAACRTSALLIALPFRASAPQRVVLALYLAARPWCCTRWARAPLPAPQAPPSWSLLLLQPSSDKASAALSSDSLCLSAGSPSSELPPSASAGRSAGGAACLH